MNNTKYQIKKQLEKLSLEEENSSCFDCGNKPALWASISNGIYLCLDCSGEHRGYGINISFIRSVKMDQWTQDQVNIMKVGGNKKLKDFLTTYEIPENLDKKEIYCSNLMNYYRKQLKAESIGQFFMEPLPPKEEFWKHYNLEETSENNNNEENTSNKEIIINIDQYRQARNNSEIVHDEERNLIPHTSSANISSISSDQHEERFGSVGNGQNNPNNRSFLSSLSEYANSDEGYFETVRDIYNTLREASTNPQAMERINNYELSGKIFSLGTKSIGGLGYMGGIIIDKGVKFLRSDTMKNIFYKVGQGLWYLKEKLIGSNSNYNDDNSNDINFENGEEESYTFLENHDYNI